MAMSKKDFIALADTIIAWNRNAPTDFAGNRCEYFTELQLVTLAEFCRDQNPRFMRDRWLDYIAGKCGKNGGAVKKSA